MYWPWKKASPSGAVRSDSLVTMISGMRNSFHVHMKTRTIRVTTAGRAGGTSIATGCAGRGAVDAGRLDDRPAAARKYGPHPERAERHRQRDLRQRDRPEVSIRPSERRSK